MEYDTIFAAARRAGKELALVDAGRLSRTVAKAAALLRENAGKVLAANALDLEAMDADSPMRDCLRLTAALILLWLILRTLKYSVVTDLTAARYVWYLYYLPMLFLPLLGV